MIDAKFPEYFGRYVVRVLAVAVRGLVATSLRVNAHR